MYMLNVSPSVELQLHTAQSHTALPTLDNTGGKTAPK